MTLEGQRRVGLQCSLDPLAPHQPYGLGLRHFSHRPDTGQAGDAKQRHAGRHRHTLAHTQFRHHAVTGRAQREARLRGAQLLAVPDQRVRDRHRPHAVACRRHQPGRGACPLQRQQLGLRRQPLGGEDGGQCLALAYLLHRCAHSEPLHVACHAGLHGDAQALIELHCANRFEGRSHIGPRHHSGTDAQVLLHARADLDTGVAPCVRVDGHQLHVHTRRFAGLVEARPRHHGVVPVQDLALVSRSGSCRGSTHGGHCRLGRATRVEAAGRQQDCRCRYGGDAYCALHGAAPSTMGVKASWAMALARSRCSNSALRSACSSACRASKSTVSAVWFDR